MVPVIVLGNHTAALHIIRTLGGRGIPVYLVHKDHLCIGRFSRYCSGFLKSPNFLTAGKDFVQFLLSLRDQQPLRNAILIPTNDYTTRLVSQHKPELEEFFFVPVAPWDILKKAFDKRLTIKIAEEAEIPIPKSFFPRNRQHMLDNLDRFRFPLVIKPAMGKRYYLASKKKMHLAMDRSEAGRFFDKIAHIMGEENIIVQEYIPGGNETLFNYACCMKDGLPYGVFTGRKVRQVPRDFGTGSAAMTCHDPKLAALGTSLLQACEYEGLAYIEFKKDWRDNTFKLIEINPRVWNFIDLAVHSGVDLPHIFYLYALNKPLPECRSQGNTFWSHFWLDFGGSIRAILKGTGHLGDLTDPFRRKKKIFCVLSGDDPLPFIMETVLLPYLYLKR
jgi:D-aspartate ligase